ncbi:putative alpha amylase, partial [Globisporangium polare]
TTVPPTGACTNYNGLDSCQSGTQTTYSDSEEVRRWQTPPRNAPGWSSGFQDYRSLTGYANVVYDSGRTSATVDVRTNLRVNTSAISCSYSFNGVASSSSTFKATSSLATDLAIKVTCTSTAGDTWTLDLEPVNFVWQSNVVTQPSGMEGGQKGAIVDLFGWPYADIEAECKDFLGKAGYMGVKINPPQESVLTDAWPQSGQRNPWYFIYQPVSYRLHSRMGTRAQLRSMIQTCRANGVRVYADAVVNHMSGGGNDVSNHRNPSGSSCTYWGAKSSADGSPYYTHNYQYALNNYTNARPALEFPAVPYGPTDFHCERTLNSWNDPVQLQNGWLVGLTDLNTGKTYVRERIAQYFVDLMGIGFSGFRIDAMKHIGPTDTAAIFGLFKTYMGGSLPSDFISWGEVIMGGEAQLLACNANSGYNFYTGLDANYAAAGISATDIAKLKIWSSDYPKEMPICGSWILPASRFVIQNDDHDQQNPDSTSRDMGDKGSILIKAKDVNAHRGFEVQLFTRTDADWKIRVVLSSYTWFTNGAAGFPDGLSDCTNGFDASAGQVCDKSVPYEKAFRAGSCGYTVEGFAGGKYTRVHRDLSIVNAMRSWIGLGSVTAAQVGITGSC